MERKDGRRSLACHSELSNPYELNINIKNDNDYEQENFHAISGCFYGLRGSSELDIATFTSVFIALLGT